MWRVTLLQGLTSALLQLPEAAAAEAIFCHVDTRGAAMNDGVSSRYVYITITVLTKLSILLIADYTMFGSVNMRYSVKSSLQLKGGYQWLHSHWR
jgi:hypothetical protein